MENNIKQELAKDFSNFLLYGESMMKINDAEVKSIEPFTKEYEELYSTLQDNSSTSIELFFISECIDKFRDVLTEEEIKTLNKK